MDVKEAIEERKSNRAFGPDPLPREVLQEIMRRALRAPSWGNTQPWNFTVVGGKTLEKIKEETVQLLEKEVPTRPEVPMPTEFPDGQTVRYKGLGRDLFRALGIERGDKNGRKAHYETMTRLFDAPYLIYLHLEKGFNPYALMDCGGILQTIALLAVEAGLGTCILARSVSYPDVVRKHVEIPDGQVLVMGMAIGHPLKEHPANQFRSERGKLEEFVRWVDVD